MAEFGQFSLALAGCLALAAACLGHAAPRSPVWANSTASMVLGQLVFVAFSFAALVYSFVVDDFSVAYVAGHSNSLLPWYFKVSATWGGHEGSFLLWILILSGWSALVALRRENYPRALITRVLATLSVLNLGFICFALFTSDPFIRLIPMTPADGGDLNPLLQDFGLIIHPPMLYAGYVGLAVPFSFAIAALLENRVDSVWARWARPWTNAAWAFLTCGIALGSWWAYYELGWGGWWFWDPSENASFMPWLAATALVHSIAVTEKRGAFKSWTLLLAIAGFSLSLLGGFIIRSGVLTSVHAFAVDPERGLYILIFLGIVVGGSLTLYGLRAGQFTTQIGYRSLSREFFMFVNNAIFMLCLTVVLWGTLAPIGYEALLGGKISLGPPFFNRFFIPLFLLLAGCLALVPVLSWKKTNVAKLKQVFAIQLPISVLLAFLITFFLYPGGVWLLIALAVGLWVVTTHSFDIGKRLLAGQSLPLGYVGMTLAHLGFAAAVIGVAVTSTQSVERDVRMAPEDQYQLGDLQVTFLGVSQKQGANYVAEQGHFVVRDDSGNQLFELFPEKRRYLAGGSIMTEAGIDAGLFADTYISLGEPLDDQAWAVRLHRKPLVRWIWLGALLMGFGGIVSLCDGRYRRLRKREMKPAAPVIA